MSLLFVLVDYDNVESSHRRAGPVNLARMLVAQLPFALISKYATVMVRLYGGWRVEAGPTIAAQKLVPDIQANSPTVVNVSGAGTSRQVKVTVELAHGPIGSRKIFEETLVRDRGLRKFRSIPVPWSQCANVGACGMQPFHQARFDTACSTSGCGTRLGDVLVRDEQKMVDTLLVSDIAQQAVLLRAPDVVVVSSDVDIWPGVHLALQVGCEITQVHTRTGWRTQRRLMETLDGPLGRRYQQMSL